MQSLHCNLLRHASLLQAANLFVEAVYPAIFVRLTDMPNRDTMCSRAWCQTYESELHDAL